MSKPIIGVDPGLQRTGYSVIIRQGKRDRLIEGGVIRTNAQDELAVRLHEIATGLRDVIVEHAPGAMAVEQAIVHGRNFRSSLMVAHVRGVVLVVGAEANLPVLQIAPTEVKRLLTGSGAASKLQVQEATQRELCLERALEPNDVADASAIALCALHQLRFAA